MASNDDMADMFERITRIIEELANLPDPSHGDAIANAEAFAEKNNMVVVGSAAPTRSCCSNNTHTDLVAVLIHSPEGAKRVQDGEIEHLSPEFIHVDLMCFDFHNHTRTMIVLDLDAAKHLHNTIGTAITEASKYQKDDGLTKLWGDA